MRNAFVLLLASSFIGCAAREGARPVDRPTVEAESTARSVAVGDRAPAIALKDIEGKPLLLEKGRVTIIVFWATWSQPDMVELRKLQEIYALHAREGLAVVAVSIDDEPSGLPEFAKTHRLRFSIGWDEGHRLASVYRPALEPTTYVVDRAGIVRFLHGAFHEGVEVEIDSEVTTLLRP